MSTLFLLAVYLLCISAAGVKAQSTYSPAIGPAIIDPSIISIASYGNSRLWILDSTRFATAYNLVHHTSQSVDLIGNSVFPIITKIRSARSVNGEILFAQDDGNKLIAMVNTTNGVWLRTFNLSDFNTFQVSSDSRLLAAAGPRGSRFNHFIDVYNTADQASHNRFMYRIDVDGMQSQGFSFNHDASLIQVTAGTSRTVALYDTATGEWNRHIAIKGVDFDAHAVASDEYGTLAMVDCERGMLRFQPHDVSIASSTIRLPGFNASLCSESIAHVGNGMFASLAGEGRMLYFATRVTAPPSSAGPPRSSSSTGSQEKSPSSSPSLYSYYTPTGPDRDRGGAEGLADMDPTPFILIMVAIIVGIVLLIAGAVAACCCFVNGRRSRAVTVPPSNVEIGYYIAPPAYDQLQVTVVEEPATGWQPRTFHK